MSAELRGEWPGGIETDPETGHLKFEVDPGDRDEDAHPVWACRFCAKQLKHTEAEHLTTIGGANAGVLGRSEGDHP